MTMDMFSLAVQRVHQQGFDESRQFLALQCMEPYTLLVPGHGIFPAALLDEPEPPLVFQISQRNHRMTYVPGRTTPVDFTRIVEMFLDAAAARFLLFYENYWEFIWLQSGTNRDRLAEPWGFARIVRNAIGHSGRITQNDPNFPTVEWHSFRYGAGDNGRRILGKGGLQPSDLFLLMIDMDQTLTALNCPD